MKTHFLRTFAAWWLVGIAAFGWSGKADAVAVKRIQTIRYKSESGKKANDLHLFFAKPTEKDDNVVFETIPYNDNNAIGTLVKKNEDPANFNELPVQLDGSGEGTKVNIEFPQKLERIDKTKSYWTRNGVEILDALVFTVGELPDIQYAFNPATNQWSASALFSNPEDAPVTYSNIQASLDNDPSQLNSDPFDTVTSPPVSFASITLDPGESELVSLGGIDPLDYDFITADAAFSSSPMDQYEVGSMDIAVPEPGPLALLVGMGSIGSVLAVHRRRK